MVYSMNVKSLIGMAVETIIKVVVVAIVVMFVYRMASTAYDFGYRVLADEPISPAGGRTFTIQITEDADIGDIAAALEEKGLIRDKNLFRVQELLSSHHDEIQPGIYDLSTSMTAAEMLTIMSQNEATDDSEDKNEAMKTSEETVTEESTTQEEPAAGEQSAQTE